MEDHVTFLLGAGASLDGGLPLASEITNLAVDEINGKRPVRWNDPQVRALNFVVAMMVAYETRSGGLASSFPDIESVVSAVELLSERGNLEISPFVQSWDPQIDSLGLHGTRGANLVGFAKRITEMKPNDFQIQEILRTFVRSEIDRIPAGKIFADLRTALMKMLQKFLFLDDPSKVDYLIPLVELGREREITISTLNYDLTIESAASRSGIEVSTGVEKWGEDWTLRWLETGVNLVKLHGSIDWEAAYFPPSTSGGSLQFQHKGVRIVDPKVTSLEPPFVIYGRREKLRAEGPFMDLRNHYSNELRRSSHLVVIGYSFTDEHINKLIGSWLSTDERRKIVIVDPAFPTNFGGRDFLSEIWRNLTKNRQLVGGHLVVEDSRILPIREPARDAIAKVAVDCVGIDQLMKDWLTAQE
jgi:hypothetical protein